MLEIVSAAQFKADLTLGLGKVVTIAFAEAGHAEQGVIKNVMPKETVDGEVTTVEDAAAKALFSKATP